MKPINDRIIVKPNFSEDKTMTKGGILLPETAREKSYRGEVIAVGPGKDGKALTVKPGDIVLYGGEYAGRKFTHDGNDYIVMREDDILIVF